MIFLCSEQENIQILGIFYALLAIFSLKCPLFYGLFIGKSRLGHLMSSLVKVFATPKCYFSFSTQNSEKKWTQMGQTRSKTPSLGDCCQSFVYEN